MKKLLFIVSLLSGISATAADIGPAGCGLGNMLLGSRDSQVFAATTNGTSGNQTFGITSGTSNCVNASGVAKLEAYVEANQFALANDVARGNGDTLAGLSQALNCRSTESVGRVLKQNYEVIFDKSEAREISTRIRETLLKESPVTVYCPGLS